MSKLCAIQLFQATAHHSWLVTFLKSDSTDRCTLHNCPKWQHTITAALCTTSPGDSTAALCATSPGNSTAVLCTTSPGDSTAALCTMSQVTAHHDRLTTSLRLVCRRCFSCVRRSISSKLRCFLVLVISSNAIVASFSLMAACTASCLKTRSHAKIQPVPHFNLSPRPTADDVDSQWLYYRWKLLRMHSLQYQQKYFQQAKMWCVKEK